MDEIVFVVFQDRATDMVPISAAGHLVAFRTWAEANAAKGVLGVVAPEDERGIGIVCKRHGLRPPKNGTDAEISWGVDAVRNGERVSCWRGWIRPAARVGA